MQNPVYRVKGCPYCGAMPSLWEMENRVLIECLEHTDFPVWIVCMKSSDEDAKLDAVESWNDNDSYVLQGADQSMVESRGSFEVTLKAA